MPVTASAIADALVERGLPPDAAAAKAALYDTVLRRHAALGTRSPGHVSWVPGRLEVFGKHTDYAGGRTLVCAVPRGFAVAASARADARVRVIDAGRGEEVTIAADGPQARHSGWRHYVDVTVRRLARNFPGAHVGADIVFASDLPSACGMSSSSALVVAVATALGRTAVLTDTSAWRANIRNPLDEASYYACVENGSSFAALAGDSGVGTHGGSEDHTAMVAGRAGHVSAFAFVPPVAVGTAALPADWRFVIAPSGVAARKTGDAREPYNRLSAATARLLDAWNREGPPATSLASALKSGPSAADRLHGLAAAIETRTMPASWLRGRLEHFIREDARVPDALAAFAGADDASLGRLSWDSQRDAELLLGNQVPATSALAASARSLGAFAACSFGAGFGGAVWALVGSDEVDAFGGRWSEGAFVMTAGPPLTEVPDIA